MRIFIISLTTLLVSLTLQAALQNDRYRLELLGNGTVRLHQGDVSADFAPEFTLIYQEKDPKLAVRPKRVPEISYSIETWETGDPTDKFVGEKVDLTTTMGDGWNPEELAGNQQGRSADIFRAGRNQEIKASKSSIKGNEIVWEFASSENIQVSARWSLAAGVGEPGLKVSFVAGKDGWYSLGYTGAQQAKPGEYDALFQPIFWTRMRLPIQSFVTAAYRCTLPATIVETKGYSWGVAADPSMLPFQPLPTLKNSQFAVALRSPEGNARPMVFVPLFGGMNSERKKGEMLEFTLHPFVNKGTVNESYVYLAREMMKVRDYRSNSFVALNTTLKNIIDYALTEYGQFNEDLRGSSYETDVPGTVNNVSSLHPLSLAILTDREDIYWRRAVPILEAGLSRQKRLFTTDPNVKGQGASTELTGPNINASELASLSSIAGRPGSLFREMADEAPSTWQKNLALYRATGEKLYLTRALSAAKSAVNELRTKKAASLKGVGFWTGSWPWVALAELYKLSGDEFILEAALEGAREYTQFIWTGPIIPEGNITVNQGGKAPLYWYMESKGKVAMEIPEESVPAWRLSEIGLTCESSATSQGHRSIFLAMPMTTMLDLAYLTGNDYFHDLSRSAIVGRSESFPGYHMNTGRSTVYEKADYPLHTLHELSYNSFHYNHIWPHAAMLADFLVTDTKGRSKGRISFPGQLADGYGYLQSRVYGSGAGQFFDHKDALLWLPLDKVSIDNVEINWLAARTPDGLGLAFSNQSHKAEKFTVKINLEQVKGRSIKATRWNGVETAAPVEIKNGEITLEVPAMGLVSVFLPKVKVDTKFGDRVGRGTVAADRMDISFPAGNGRAYLLSLGKDLTHAYVYVRAKAADFKEVQMHYRIDGGQWQAKTDAAYPFEFSVKVPDGKSIEFRLDGVRADGTVHKGTPQTLK